MTKVWRLVPAGETLLSTLLARRGFSNQDDIDRYLAPDYTRDLHDPFLMTGMDKAVARILKAIRQQESIVIFADYDADGVPGAALLASFFKKVGHLNFSVYIPNRHEEAFGLNRGLVEDAARRGVGLIITVDCGSTNVAEVKRANELGVDIIITDHHLTPELLPPALAIINPKLPGSTYPEPMLSGSGVAFKLVQALIARGRFGLPVGFEKWLLDLVAIATVADMVPLVGENRALVHFGLKVLRQTPRPGLRALIMASGLSLDFLTEDDIAFTLGPRLNAASRMAHALEAYELLTTESEAVGETLARRLVSLNQARRQSVETILRSVSTQVGGPGLEQPLLVVGDRAWSLGVLGLAAARLVETYGRPTFVWGQNSQGLVKGSCRSDGRVNMVELMAAAGGKELFDDFGGHVRAGGFSLQATRVAELGTRLNAARAELPDLIIEEDILIDGLLSPIDVTLATHNLIKQLSPFGLGNPKPLFLFPAVKIEKVRRFGDGRNHLELTIARETPTPLGAIGFFLGPRLDDGQDGAILKQGEPVDLLAHLELSTYRSVATLRLRLVDWRVAS